MRKESTETGDYMFCQNMEIDDDKSLEVSELLRVKHMCDKKCNEKSVNF